MLKREIHTLNHKLRNIKDKREIVVRERQLHARIELDPNFLRTLIFSKTLFRNIVSCSKQKFGEKKINAYENSTNSVRSTGGQGAFRKPAHKSCGTKTPFGSK